MTSTGAAPLPRVVAEYAGYALTVAAVWLGWEVIKAPIVERAPPALAVRLAPTSPEVLRRAAEEELIAQEPEDAAALAEASLAKAPFNARALRVRGLAAARGGQEDEADQLLTLAGNWSLRDDPAHAWLVEHRLKQGDYGSSFAHADTLLRRRADLYPQIFDLFAKAAALDQRAIPPIARLLEVGPPWRWAFLGHLRRDPDGDAVLLALGLTLEGSDAPLDTSELSDIYQHWLGEGRLEAMRILRERTGRPPADRLVTNGDFSDPMEKQVAPFGWALGIGPGLNAEVLAHDDDRDNNALRVDYDGYGATTVASQVLALKPGLYALSIRQDIETWSGNARLEWRIACLETPEEPLPMSSQVGAQEQNATWEVRTMSFVIPSKNCNGQYLRLAPAPSDRRAPIAVWYDDVRIVPRSLAETR